MPMASVEQQESWAEDVEATLAWCRQHTNNFDTLGEYEILFRYAAGWTCRPRSESILEIGAYEGQSDVVLVRALQARCLRLGLPAERLVAVDPCEGLVAAGLVDTKFGSQGWTTFAQWHKFLLEHDAYGQVVPVVATTAQALPLLRRLRVRMMFIDGDHFNPGLRVDTDLADEVVVPGGVVLFHDCRERRDDSPTGWYYDVEPEVQRLLDTGGWRWVEKVDHMAVLERV